MTRNRILFFIIPTVAFVLGAGICKAYPHIKVRIAELQRSWDPKATDDWPAEFNRVQMPSSNDGRKQPAYFTSSSDEQPLLVSLHTWSGDYLESDPLAMLARKAGWNYIHPNFRGANRTREACLSSAALSDIDDAINFAIKNGRVDTKNIFVVGVSGGGYATVGSFMKTVHQIKGFFAWAPISDLISWYRQSRHRKSGYAEDILKCTSSQKTGLDEQEARRRSPIYWDPPEFPRGKLEIYAGIDDGYTGSIPISHSVLFFNKLAHHYGHGNAVLNEEEIIGLLTRSTADRREIKSIGGRTVILERNTPFVGLTVFEGGHEMLPNYMFDHLRELSRNKSPAPNRGVRHAESLFH